MSSAQDWRNREMPDFEASAATPLQILTHEFYPTRGGIATWAEGVATAATELGFTVTVWAPQHKQLTSREWPFAVESLPVKGTQGRSDRRLLMETLRAKSDQLRDAIVYLCEPAPLRAWISFGENAPASAHLILGLHGSEIERLSRFPHGKSFRRLLAKADRIGVNSLATDELLRARQPGLDTGVILNYGAPRQLPPVTEPPALPRGTFEILLPGRIHPRKGQLALVRAAKLLPQEIRNKTRLHLLGPINRPGYLASVERLARQDPAVELVLTTDADDEALALAYARATVVALPSQPAGKSIEGFGLVILEAGQFSKAVVATRLGGIPEAVRHDQTGLLVPPGVDAAFAEALERLLRDTSYRRRLGEGNKAWADTFTWRRTARQLFADFARHPLP